MTIDKKKKYLLVLVLLLKQNKKQKMPTKKLSVLVSFLEGFAWTPRRI